MPDSLQTRLALGLALALSLLWLIAAGYTAVSLRHEMDEVFDSAMQETAQRLLPLAVLEIVNREDGVSAQSLAPIRDHEELFTYVVRDAQGQVLMRSHGAEPDRFPDWRGPGFHQGVTHRYYSEATLQGAIRMTLAEPLAHRQAVLRAILLRQALPLMLVLPLTLAVVWLVLRLGMGGVRRFCQTLAARDPRDLTPVPFDRLPRELRPVAETLNALLARLSAAFEAERSFAANAAHELRTPLAGALAQAQRLRHETPDAASAARAAAIEDTLKRLTRTSERLMQLARAEGGRLRLDIVSDLRIVARVVTDELARGAAADRISLSLPERPVLSDLDPDVFAILCRNLIENALRHGAQTEPVEVCLTAQGVLSVANAGPVVAGQTLAGLTARFARSSDNRQGSGIGLAIVAAIAERIETRLILRSPRAGRTTGFEAVVTVPVSGGPDTS